MKVECEMNVSSKIHNQGNGYKYLLGEFSFKHNNNSIFSLLKVDEQEELMDLLNEVDDGAELVGVFPNFLIFELIYSSFSDSDKVFTFVNECNTCIENYLTTYEVI